MTIAAIVAALLTFTALAAVAVTADLRAITGEVLTKHLGVPPLASVFPGWTPSTLGLLV